MQYWKGKVFAWGCSLSFDNYSDIVRGSFELALLLLRDSVGIGLTVFHLLFALLLMKDRRPTDKMSN
jgi:hypothetical protein